MLTNLEHILHAYQLSNVNPSALKSYPSNSSIERKISLGSEFQDFVADASFAVVDVQPTLIIVVVMVAVNLFVLASGCSGARAVDPAW